MLNKAKTTLLALALAVSFGAQAAEITGAGASFVYPAMSKWSADYNKATKNKINYQSIGSGGGIAQIKAGTVDFGSSDAPLKVGDLTASGLAQFPSAMGAVVPVINLPGMKAGQVRFTGPLLADIFLVKITKWNDPAIAPAPPSTGLIIFRKSAWIGVKKSVKVPRSSGRPDSAAKATRVLPHTSSKSKAPLAI